MTINCLFCDQTKLKRFHVRQHKNKRTCWYKAMQFMQILCINVILQIPWSLAFFQITKFCLVIVILYYRYSIYEKLCMINKHISNLCLVIWFHLFSMWNMPFKQFEKFVANVLIYVGDLSLVHTLLVFNKSHSKVLNKHTV